MELTVGAPRLVAGAPQLLAGTTVLVTGGSGNLGSKFAASMASAGADVVLGGRHVGRLESTAAAIEEATGRRVGWASGDLTDAGAVADMADQAWDTFGRVDAVVNSAVPAVSPQQGDLMTTPDEAWWTFYDPVVVGVLRLARSLVPRMAENGGGAFVNIVSPTGMMPSPGVDAYGVAKSALIMLTKYMAQEWGPMGIRANAVAPGLIVDDQHVTPESIQASPTMSASLARTSLGRWGQPEDLVGIVGFLASDAAAFISGQVISVDGGRF